MRPTPRQRRLLVLLGGGALAAAAVTGALSCGADDLVAPRMEKSEELASCRSFEELMPRFTQAISSGQTEGLRQVLKNEVLVNGRAGEPSPLLDLLRSVFATFATFARQGPERGASPGQICATPPPPVAQAHPLCEIRRALDSLVHDGKGLKAFQLVDPQVTAILKYILGQAPASSVPHYEVATVLQRMCGQNAVCQISDTLDLIIALTAFAETSEGRTILNNTQQLLHNPGLQPFLTNNAEQYGGENGVIALVRVVLQTVQGMDDPSDLDALPISSLPANLRADAQRGLTDLKSLLDPKREPNVLRPLKKVSSCLNGSDANLDAIRMFYRLWFDAKLPEFSFPNTIDVAVGLRDTDSRGTLLHLANTLVTTIRQDESSVDSAAAVCRVLFAKENAQRALPVVATLFEQGVVSEFLCATDTLVYGCAGGSAQLACKPAGATP